MQGAAAPGWPRNRLMTTAASRQRTAGLRGPWPTPPHGSHCLQGCFSIFIFVLLASEDGFKTEWHKDEHGILRAPAVYNGAWRWRTTPAALALVGGHEVPTVALRLAAHASPSAGLGAARQLGLAPYQHSRGVVYNQHSPTPSPNRLTLPLAARPPVHCRCLLHHLFHCGRCHLRPVWLPGHDDRDLRQCAYRAGGPQGRRARLHGRCVGLHALLRLQPCCAARNRGAAPGSAAPGQRRRAVAAPRLDWQCLWCIFKESVGARCCCCCWRTRASWCWALPACPRSQPRPADVPVHARRACLQPSAPVPSWASCWPAMRCWSSSSSSSSTARCAGIRRVAESNEIDQSNLEREWSCAHEWCLGRA